MSSNSRSVVAGGLHDWLRVLVANLERGIGYDTDGERTDALLRYPLGYATHHDAMDEPVIPESPPSAPNSPRPGFSETVRIGDRVRITEGSFANSEGEIKRLEAGSWHITITVTFWGRPLEIELEQHQLAIIERGQQSPITGDWNGCEDPYQLTGFLGFAVTARKLRLFTAACYRNLLDSYAESAALLATIEEHAEGASECPTLREAATDFECDVGTPSGAPEHFGTALHALFRVSFSQIAIEALGPQMIRWGFGTPDLIREIFPNPFAAPQFDPAWRSSDVIALAEGIYADRAFERMPILADALQDAGCDNAELLAHCRDESKTHVRGCWALDLSLGRE